MKVMECNESWVTLTTLDGTSKEAHPLNDIELSYDHDHGKNRLKIHVTMLTDYRPCSCGEPTSVPPAEPAHHRSWPWHSEAADQKHTPHRQVKGRRAKRTL